MKTDNTIDILIFKTNVKTEQDLTKVASLLHEDHHIRKWSVDREDIDHVLRIEASGVKEMEIRQKMEHAGFLCEELVD